MSINKIEALLLTLILAMTSAGCGNYSDANMSNDRSNSAVRSNISSAFVTGKDKPVIGLSTKIDKELPAVEEHEDDEKIDEAEIELNAGDNELIEDNYSYLDELYNNLTEEEAITLTQLNSINMLNYMSSLTQRINASKCDQLALEAIYQSLDNDIYPNSVDSKTQAQINLLMDTIKNYRMIDVKRDRLQYIYEKNIAQAYRKAIPNPIALLSTIQSGNLLKAAASVLYMTVDSAFRYNDAVSAADLQYLQSGWELDDAETEELHTSTKNQMNYMLDTVRTYSLPGDYALNRESIEQFISWSNKPDSQIEGKISWLEANRKIYSKFGPYWLELVKDYYNYEDYDKCLDAIRNYESVATRIFRQDTDYANAIPMAIIAAKESLDQEQYVDLASKYCDVLVNNAKDSEWNLRYFAAQIYLDLYTLTENKDYLDKAYNAVFYNVNILVNVQREQNSAYLADVVEVKADKNASKHEKRDIKEHNKALRDERKKALPPVNEAFYLNCDLLFAMADECSISTKEKTRIDAILHENNNSIFLTRNLDDRFWFNNPNDEITSLNDINILFDGERLTIPVSYASDSSIIKADITWADGSKELDDWAVQEVKRTKKGTYQDYTVTYTSKSGKDAKYKAGDKIVITITPVAEAPEDTLEFKYNVVSEKKALVFNGIRFERQYDQ